MSNMRVYEYAREHDLTSREVLQYLEELNIEITNHMATIDSDIQKQLDDMIYGEADTEDVQVDKVAQKQEELTQVHEEVEIAEEIEEEHLDRKSTRLNSSHVAISYAVFCLKKKKEKKEDVTSNKNDNEEQNEDAQIITRG